MGQTFEELIGQHLDDLYSAALCFTLSEHQAEDLLQEASIRAFHEFSRARWGEGFRRAMLEILVSIHLQRLRRQGRDPLTADRPASVGDSVSTRSLEPFAPFPEPGTSAYRMLLSWIGRVWWQLDDGDRLVLWLADVERLSHRRVADMVGLLEEDVRARHYRARLALSRDAARELHRGASAEEGA